MTEDIDDEVKVFRKTDKEEAADAGIDPDILADDDDTIPSTYPVASSSTGSLMPPGFGIGGLAAFSPSLYFSPAYLSPAMPMVSPFMMQPQAQAYTLLSMAYNNMNNMQKAANANQQNQGQNSPMTPRSAAKMKSVAKENRENHKDRIKKPLNAFMIFMQEMRPKLQEQEEYANMQSAELNRELGKRWTALDEAEQKVYFEKYRQGKIEHEKMYPGWSARDNYTVRRRRNTSKPQVHTPVVSRSNYSGSESNEPKKCRALYGINNQAQWCRHCKRKKRCLLVRTHDNDDTSSRDTSPTTPSSNVDLPDVHHPVVAPPSTQPLPSNALASPFGNLNINEHQQVNVPQDLKSVLPPQSSAAMTAMAPQAPPQVMNPMMAQFGMQFPMYPPFFPQFMGMPQHLMTPNMANMAAAPIKSDGYGMGPAISNADVKP